MKDNQSFPIEERTNFTVLIKFIGTLFIGLIVGSEIIDGYRWYIAYGEDLFTLVMFCFLFIVIIFIGLGLLVNLKEKVYIITCPCCKQKTVYPVGAEGINCTCCQKRLVMSENEITYID